VHKILIHVAITECVDVTLATKINIVNVTAYNSLKMGLEPSLLLIKDSYFRGYQYKANDTWVRKKSNYIKH
jgi:hypothetical protein